ncbi:MAG: hypothetical protein AAF471_07565, partial [Myxococcota bacterium]
IVVNSLRETNAIAQVVRCFDDDNIIHVAGKVDPLADIEVINTELCLADQESVEKALHKAQKQGRSGDKEAKAMEALLQKISAHLDEAKPLRAMELNDDEQAKIKSLHLITNKPSLYIANVEEEGGTDNPWITKLEELAKQEGSQVIPVCAGILDFAGVRLVELARRAGPFAAGNPAAVGFPFFRQLAAVRERLFLFVEFFFQIFDLLLEVFNLSLQARLALG